jgi:hypothetical protein
MNTCTMINQSYTYILMYSIFLACIVINLSRTGYIINQSLPNRAIAKYNTWIVMLLQKYQLVFDSPIVA